MAGINVVIGSTIDPAVKQNLDALSKMLDEGAINAAKTSGALDTVSAALIPLQANLPKVEANLKAATNPADIPKLQQEFYKLTQAIQQVQNSAKNSVGGVNQASNALLNLGRVAQDAPFGFIGIQNNINPLLESFQRLRAETGSNAGALKALVGAFSGGAGLGLAVSLATSALTILTQSGFFKAKEGAEKAKKSNDEYAESLKRAAAAAGEEFTQVSKLITSAFDPRNAAIEKQKTILSDLQHINASYFGDLKIENGLITGLSQAYARYADNIFSVAKAKGAQDQISKLSTQLVDVTGKINDVTNKLSPNSLTLKGLAASGGFDNLSSTFDKIKKSLDGVFLTQEDISLISSITGKNESEINKIFNDRSKLRTQELQIVGQISELSKFINTQDFTGTKDAKIQKDEIDKVAEALRRLAIAREEAQNNLLNDDEGKLKSEIQIIQSGIKELLGLKVPKESTIIFKLLGDASLLDDQLLQIQLNKAYAKLKTLKPPKDLLPPVELPAFGIVGFTLSQAQAEATLIKQRQILQKAGKKVFSNQAILTDVKLLNDDEVNKNFKNLQNNIANTAELLQSTLNPLFDALFNSIGKGSQSAAQAIGEAAKQMVLNLAKAAAEAAVLSLILNAIFPGAAAGSFSFSKLFSSLSGLPKFASGGLVSGPVVGLLGEGFGTSASNPEVVAPLDKLKQYIGNGTGGSSFDGRLSGRLSGTDIFLSQERTQSSRNRIYGTRVR